MQNLNKQPIIILGGFLIDSDNYLEMAKFLEDKEKVKVKIITVNKSEWLFSTLESGWKNILNKIEFTIKELKKELNSSKFTLIGHSSGGVMLRLYLSEKEIAGKVFNGKKYCNNLITLGSPHQANKATKLRRMVDELFPGCYFSEHVNYCSIGGKLSNNNNSLITKLFSNSSYKSISGEDKSNGDGLVPLTSSLLKDSKQIILEDVSHGKIFGKRWYGARSVVDKWWNLICSNH